MMRRRLLGHVILPMDQFGLSELSAHLSEKKRKTLSTYTGLVTSYKRATLGDTLFRTMATDEDMGTCNNGVALKATNNQGLETMYYGRIIGLYERR